MSLGPTAVALAAVSILLVAVLLFGLVWIIPIFIQKQKAYIKRKTVQKKVNEEMVRNIRYRSPSTVGCSPQILKSYDYGSTQSRSTDFVVELPSMGTDPERNDVPSINVTCDEEPLARSPDKSGSYNNLEVFSDKGSLQNSKRRFSSIVFCHSNEIKVLSDDDNLEVNDKKERRASMSLFDTCKLAMPELGQGLAHSTEHLNDLTLPANENQGKLYFMLSQNDDAKGSLDVVVIKITDLVNRKHKEYKVQTELVESNSKVLWSQETELKICSGEVINFDESFRVDIGDDALAGIEGCLFLVFTLVHVEGKRTAKVNKLGEIRFDLMELIEGRVLRFDGQEQFVICRNFADLSNEIKPQESGGKTLIFLRFTKIGLLNFVIGISELKGLCSGKPFTGVNIRISLATEAKVIESRRSKVIKKKYQNSEGVLKVDESFEFNLAAKDSTKLLMNRSNETVFITVFVCGRSNIGFSHVLGKCVIGPIEFADGTGLFHWNKAISNPGEIVYHWHNLKN